MTALRPGASPPPVRTPICLSVGMAWEPCYTRSSISSVTWAASSAGRALRSQCRGQGFDPPAVHQDTKKPGPISRLFLCPRVDLLALRGERCFVGVVGPFERALDRPAGHYTKEVVVALAALCASGPGGHFDV